jgi:Abortive infection alpha
MVDPFALGVTAATAAGILAKQGQDFIAAVSGHPGETIGTILGRMAKQRRDNAQVIGGMAHLTLLNLGLKAQEIPLPVLGPLLEGASFQDEPSMQEIWANLLANAADPRQADKVLPAFISILKDLTPSDAKFLTAIHAKVMADLPVRHGLFTDIRLDIFQLRMIFTEFVLQIPQPANGRAFGVAVDNQFQARIELFVRQGLLTVRTADVATINQKIVAPHKRPNDTWSLSNLGWSFMAACRPPVPTAPPKEP